MLSDLKDLENEGIDVQKPFPMVIKAGVAAFVGDNLGAHHLAEMSCSFSSGPICRMCKATYKDVCENFLLYSGCKEDYHPDKLTPDLYDKLADIAVENGGATKETLGIKGHCTFNSLKSFHCIGSLAPCLGHDYYEGVFAYDIQAILTYIINTEKLITADQFNLKLKKCEMSERDRKNRPNGFKTRATNSKYEGTSGSLRILSRVITIVLAEILARSKTKELLLKLQEVSEIVTAPSLSHYEVDYLLHPTILEYLDLRVLSISTLNFSRPRPKHHYLSHYSEAFKIHGPLIGVWGMRMESKHTYMKTVIRTAKNFKNPAKTCATRHQFAQISYAYFGVFLRNPGEIPDGTLIVSQVPTTKDAFQRKFLETLSPRALYPAKVTVMGTLYAPGMILIFKKEKFGILKVGLLKGISMKDKNISFGCSTFECSLSEFGYYVTVKLVSDFECITYTDLWDYHPLHRIGGLNSFVFALHHFISQKY